MKVTGEVKGKLLKNVKNVVGGLYSMNAPNAIGYLFCKNKKGDEISVGMFCHRKEEIDSPWDYYLDYKTKRFYSLE